MGPGGVVVGLARLGPAPPKKTGGSQNAYIRFAPNLGILPATPYVTIWRNTIDFQSRDFENGVVPTALLCCCLWKRSEKELQIGGKSWCEPVRVTCYLGCLAKFGFPTQLSPCNSA